MDCPYIPDEGLVPPTPVRACPYLAKDSYKCTVTNSACLVDVEGHTADPTMCLRYAWIVRATAKVNMIGKLTQELAEMGKERLAL